MGLEDLVDRLERDAEARKSALLEAAEQEAVQLEALAEREAEEARRDHLGRRRRERSAEHTRTLAAARLEALGRRLAAEQTLLQRGRARLDRLVDAVEERPELADALARHLEEAFRYLSDGPVRVLASPGTALRLRPLLEDRPDCELTEALDAPPGVRVEGPGVVVDNSIPARVEGAWGMLSMRLLRALGAS